MIELGRLVMIPDLHRQGLSVSQIARQCGIDRKTIHKYIDQGVERAPDVATVPPPADAMTTS